MGEAGSITLGSPYRKTGRPRHTFRQLVVTVALFCTLPLPEQIYKGCRGNTKNRNEVFSVARQAFAQAKTDGEAEAAGKLALVKMAQEQWAGIKTLLSTMDSSIPKGLQGITPNMPQVVELTVVLAQLGIAKGGSPTARFVSVFGTANRVLKGEILGASPRAQVAKLESDLAASEKEYEAAARPSAPAKAAIAANDREAQVEAARRRAGVLSASIEDARAAAKREAAGAETGKKLSAVPRLQTIGSEESETAASADRSARFASYQEGITEQQRALASAIGEQVIDGISASYFTGSYTLRYKDNVHGKKTSKAKKYDLKRDSVTAIRQLVDEANNARAPGTTVPGMAVVRLESWASALQALTEARAAAEEYKRNHGDKKVYAAAVKELNYYLASLLSTKKPEDARKNAMMALEHILEKNAAAGEVIDPRVTRFLLKARWEHHSNTSPNLTKDPPVVAREDLDEFIGYAEDAVRNAKKGPILDTVAKLIERCKSASQAKGTTPDEMFRLSEALEAGVAHMLALQEKESALEKASKLVPGVEGTPQFQNAKAAYEAEMKLFRLAFGNPDHLDAHSATMTDITLESLVTVYPHSMINMENSFLGWEHIVFLGTVRQDISAAQRKDYVSDVYGSLRDKESVLVAALGARKPLFFPWLDSVSDKSGRSAALQLMDDSVPQGLKRTEQRYRRNADTAAIDDLSRGMLPYIEDVWAPFVAGLKRQGYAFPELNLKPVVRAEAAVAKAYANIDMRQLRVSPASLKAQYAVPVEAGNEALLDVLSQLASAWDTVKRKQDGSGATARIVEAEKTDPVVRLLHERAWAKYKLVMGEDGKGGLAAVYRRNTPADLSSGSVDGAWANPVRAIQLLTTAVRDLQDADKAAKPAVVPPVPKPTEASEVAYSIAMDRPNYENQDKRFAVLSWSAKTPLAPLFKGKMFSYMAYEEDMKSPVHCYYAMSNNETAHGVKAIARLSDDSSRAAYFYVKWDYKRSALVGFIDAQSGWNDYGPASRTSDAELEKKGIRRFVFEHVYEVVPNPKTDAPEFKFHFTEVSVPWLRDAFRVRLDGDELAKKLGPDQTSYSFSRQLTNGGHDRPPGVYMNEYEHRKLKMK